MAHVPFGHQQQKTGILDKAATVVSAASKIHSIYKAGVAAMPCLPEALGEARFYSPGARGFEQRIAERMRANDELRRGV